MEQPHEAGLSQSQSLPVSESLPLPVGWRLRDRLFPVLTMGIAVIWAWSATEVAVYVGSMNTARAIGALMTGSMSAGPPMQSFPGTLFNIPLSPPTVSQAQEQQNFKKKTATVEVVVYIWRAAMWVVAGVLAIIAVLSVVTGRFRFWHLCAATLILSGTAATLIGLWLLTRPDWGGMPPLSGFSYIYVAAAQSAYAIFLLMAFARKPSFGRNVRISTCAFEKGTPE